jgi:hypothetical protein
MILIIVNDSEITKLIIDSKVRIIAGSGDYNSSWSSNFFNKSRRISVNVSGGFRYASEYESEI